MRLSTAHNIIGVACQCPNCGGESLYRIDNTVRVKPKCQYCELIWYIVAEECTSILPLHALRRLLDKDREMVAVKLAVRYHADPA